MKIGLCGSRGILGNAMAYGFRKLGHEILEHDLVIEGSRIENLLPAHLIFICVPTPPRTDGGCNTDIVEACVSSLINLGYKGHIVIKSTTTPGFTQSLIDKSDNPYASISHSAEWLRERHSFHDFTEGHHLLVIGTHSDAAYDLIVKVHGHYPKNIVKMTPTESEAAKYFHNVFNALRVVYANGFYEFCQKIGANYTKIKNAVVRQPTHVDYYLDCNNAFRGYAGVCLSKEAPAMQKFAKDLGLPCKIFDVIVSDNELYPKTVPSGMRME
jgi:UDPglucose 6-dehydrogenase